MRELCSRIESGTASVGVVGLGYVGLPVACLLAETGFSVTGIDLKADRVTTINAGRSPIEGREPGLGELLVAGVRSGRLRASSDPTELHDADVVIIAVETPVDPSDHRPRYSALRAACGSLAETLQGGAVVIVESTIAPGTMDRVVRPLLEPRGIRVGHCPERVMPGRLLQNLRTMSRVMGADSPEVADAMRALYSRYVDADLDATDLVTAELVKTTENAYRDVNIAFANQVALICQEVGGDVWKVRELVNKSPGRNMLFPGAGVGGHCIPKDPWLLASALSEGTRAPLIEVAREMNASMPGEVGRLTVELLHHAGVELREALVAVLGYSYLEDSDDTRDSPSEHLLPVLSSYGIKAKIHDPFVDGMGGDVYEVMAGADCVILMVKHSEYSQLDLARAASVMARPLLVDARHAFSVDALRHAGFRFSVLGTSTETETGSATVGTQS
jgi:UDP-N-acetyl-D-mannosaminuronic acid dehydrogenase